MGSITRAENAAPAGIDKAATGIGGFDQITGGGLPKGRPTLVAGAAGAGKTLFGVEFLVRGATQFNEPGVFIAFEENADELTRNVASLGFDLGQLQAEGKLGIDSIQVERAEIEETGEYDLEGLFVRLGFAIDQVGAKRIVLDTLEALFASFSNHFVLRAELRRLFRWLKARGLTAVITAEKGDGVLTRHGLEEYVSDCVVLLDNRVVNQVATRRMRIVKYRGSAHGQNEYPFLIGENGFSVLPVTSLALEHTASTERITSGVRELDEMLGGEGYFRGSSVLISGTAGTGKSSLAGYFADSTCRRGERCLYFAFEESPSQIVRNMRSIGLDLQPWREQGLLHIHAARPTMFGLEMHLALMHKMVDDLAPTAVVLDPVTNFTAVGSVEEVKVMLMRFIDFLKTRQITAMCTSLTAGGDVAESSEVGLSSLMDAWLLLRNLEIEGERNRALYLLKSRGMAHSNQVREFILSDDGIRLAAVYVGPGGVLTGSARVAQEARDRASDLADFEDTERRRSEIVRRKRALEARIEGLRAEFEAETAELEELLTQGERREKAAAEAQETLRKSRGVKPGQTRGGER